jgi:hypothetical protein
MSRPPEYKPEYCDIANDLGKAGKSITQIASALNVTRRTVYNWMNDYPEFLYACELGKTHAEAQFEEIGQAQLVAPTPGFQAGLYNKMMSCRFPETYTDKTKTDITTGGEKLSLDINLVRK